MRASTAAAMSAALITSSRATPAGVASVVGPATSVTSAPASAQACASAKPILPELELVMPRTGSMVSNVGPAVSSTRLPARCFGCAHAINAARISSGSSMRPSPISPHAWSPLPGPRICTPSARSCAALRCVAAAVHICRFIAGATSKPQSRARQSVESRSSAAPCASLAMKSADAGATTITSACLERSMCPIALAAPESHRSVSTGLPDSACSVIGAMNCVAARVITTSTAIPSLTSSRVSSADLYAAIPPVMPSTTRRTGRAGTLIVIRLANGVGACRSLIWPETRVHRGVWRTMGIADWPQDERPRERLLKLGPGALSEAELLAIFLRTGTAGKSAVELGRDLLQRFGGLQRLFAASLEEVASNLALGPAKYAQLHAVVEMARRPLSEPIGERDAMSSPRALRGFLTLSLGNRPHEVFVALFLDAQNRLLGSEELFRGTLTQTSVYPREVVKTALRYNAAGVIFAHNHPSGLAEPSRADELLTQTLKQALSLVEIKTLDHFVVAGTRTVSLAGARSAVGNPSA